MHLRLIEVTGDIDRAQHELLKGYEPRPLYNFRVAARRIRSILKQMDSHRSRVLRKAWGGLAAVTGDARDWDVFLANSKELLDSTKFCEFEAINHDRAANARKNVIEMLKSSLWQQHIRDWRDFLEQAEEAAASPDQARESLDRSVSKALRRLGAARADGTDHNWHRYRIAVKELRYVAEANPDQPGAASLAQEARSYQTLLGDWHDTVVQLNLLDELPPQRVHDELAAAIRDRQAGYLSKMRALPPIGQPEL
jgi:phosphohistidine phosphatase